MLRGHRVEPLPERDGRSLGPAPAEEACGSFLGPGRLAAATCTHEALGQGSWEPYAQHRNGGG